jgi:hypothetical protein
MTPEEAARQIADMAAATFRPPMMITSEYAGQLLELIVREGTLKMKAEALEISTRFMSRMGEWS